MEDGAQPSGDGLGDVGDPPPLPAALLIQTPLQDALTDIYSRLRGQHRRIAQVEGRFAELQDRVDFVVKQTADGQKALTDDVLRKFEQRLQDCTRAAEAAGAAEKQALLVRISALEDKLLGADNVGGHLAAVSDIAGILGLSIPPSRTSSRKSDGAAGAVAWGGDAAGGHPGQQAHRPSTGSRLAAGSRALELPSIEEQVGGLCEGEAEVQGMPTAADAQLPLAVHHPHAAFTARQPSSLATADSQQQPAQAQNVGLTATPSGMSLGTQRVSAQESMASAAVLAPAVTEAAAADAAADAGAAGEAACAGARGDTEGCTGVPAYTDAPSSLAGKQPSFEAAAAGASLAAQSSRPASPTAGPGMGPAVASAAPAPGISAESTAAAETAGKATEGEVQGGDSGRGRQVQRASSVRFESPASPALHRSSSGQPSDAASLDCVAQREPSVVQQGSGAAAAAPCAVQPEAAAVPAPGVQRGSSFAGFVAAAVAQAAPAALAGLEGSGGQAEHSSAAGVDSSSEQHGSGALPPEERSSLHRLASHKSGAVRSMADVVLMLRRRPNVAQSGLLWKLQASLHDAVMEQERLKSEVEVLRAQLSAAELGSVGERMDAVEEKAMVAVLNNREVGPSISFADLKVLEDKVVVMGGQVADSAGRIAIIEEQLASREASETASELLSPDKDSLAVLESHLLSQQQKLQKYMDSLATTIQAGIPGQVNSTVNATVMEVSRSLERRLADKLATKQDMQALSIRVSGKVSREEVERMLRRVEQGLPKAHAPASGTRLKCISCDSDLQPVIFASAGGSNMAAAELRYSQLPSVSPPRQPNSVPQPNRPVSPTSMLGSGLGSAQPSSAVLGRPGGAATPSARRAGMGAPIAWLHQMRRDSGAGTPGSGRVGTAPDAGADAAAGGSWEGAAFGTGEDGTGSHPMSGVLLGLQQQEGLVPAEAGGSPSRRGSASLLAQEGQGRQFGWDGVADRRRGTAASQDGASLLAQGEAGAAGGAGPRVSKLGGLPALAKGGSGEASAGGSSPSRIRALHPLAASSSSTSLSGVPADLAAEASLTVQAVQPLPHPPPPPGRTRRPVTAAPHKAAGTVAAVVEVVADAVPEQEGSGGEGLGLAAVELLPDGSRG